MDPAIFKAYDIRGLYPDQIDETDAWKIGYAAARFLRSHLTVDRQITSRYASAGTCERTARVCPALLSRV